jgi:hypothetical protein
MGIEAGLVAVRSGRVWRGLVRLSVVGSGRAWKGEEFLAWQCMTRRCWVWMGKVWHGYQGYLKRKIMKTPYDTGKVKIGSAVYLNRLVNQPYVEEDMDMLRLQSYLIHDPARLKRAYWTNRALLISSMFVCLIVLLAN